MSVSAKCYYKRMRIFAGKGLWLTINLTIKPSGKSWA
jgi:hypothetical protein